MPVTTILVRPDGSSESGHCLGDLGPHLADPETRVWVDLLDPTPEDYDALRGAFGFHPLAIEDCHNRVQRPKVEDYGGYLFSVFHGLNLNEGADPLNLLELDSFLGANYLVTVRYGRLFSIQDVRARVEKNPALLQRGPDYAFYMILDRMVEYYFDLMDRLDDEIDTIEDRLFQETGEALLQAILDLKRRVLALRRVAAPQREVLGILTRGEYSLVRENTRYYFRDVYDHMLRIAESLEGYRDMMGSAMDTYITQLSNRTNDIMKVLSIIATIMLPLSFLTGFFGMNFEHLPGLRSSIGVWVLVGFMAVLSGTMLLYFRRKRWI